MVSLSGNDVAQVARISSMSDKTVSTQALSDTELVATFAELIPATYRLQVCRSLLNVFWHKSAL